jgi:hypothetical protein
LSVFAGKNTWRTATITELGSRLAPGSGRPAEGFWLFTALVLTAAIPVLLLGGWMTYITADQERSYAREAAAQALTQVAHRIEGEISREVQVAETLASSAALDRDGLQDFYLEATRIVAARPLWETAALTRPNQEQVLNVLRPLGAPLGPVTDTDSFNAVLRTKKPVLGGLGPYQAAIGKQLVSLRVPVLRDGELRYVLTIGLLPDQIGTILSQAGLPAGWAGTVVDAREKIVARTPDTKIAKAVATTPAVQDAMARGGSNSPRTQTREGVDVETVHRMLAGTEGWSVHVGVPVSELNAPVSRSLRLLFGGTAASVGLAIALGLVIAREIAQRRRLEALQSAAALLGDLSANLGQFMSRDREVILRGHRPALCAIAHWDRATQYSETPMIEPRSRGVLVPRFRGDDNCVALFTRRSGARAARATVRNCAPENPTNRGAGRAMDSGPAPKEAHPGMMSEDRAT